MAGSRPEEAKTEQIPAKLRRLDAKASYQKQIGETCYPITSLTASLGGGGE